jgi:hypothetical protein
MSKLEYFLDRLTDRGGVAPTFLIHTAVPTQGLWTLVNRKSIPFIPHTEHVTVSLLTCSDSAAKMGS